MSPLLGSSNGLILLRTSPGVWTQVYAVPGAVDGQSIYSFLASSPQCFAGYLGDFAARNSLDGGMTWTNTGVTYVSPAQFLLCLDEAGRIYADNVDSLYRSTDFGASWSLAFSVPPGADTINDFALLGGYVWWEFTDPTGADARVWRTDEDGNNPTSFTSANLVRTGNDSQVITGAFARLYQYISQSDAAANGNVCCIDVTDPDNPVFSLTEAPFGGNFPLYILPLAQDIAIAHTQTSDNSQGSLWRTTDGGQTWTEVLSNDPSLGGPNGLNELCATLVVDPVGGSTVWAAGVPPTVWYSTDQGVTWTQETVGDANGASAWTGVGVGISGPIPILASSVQNLRDQIDTAFQQRGQSPFPWTDPSIVRGVLIRASQFIEMSQAIQALWYCVALGALPDWTDGAPGGPSVGTTPTLFRASHFTDLQGWFATYEATPPPYAGLGQYLGLNVATNRPLDTPPSTPDPDGSLANDIAQLCVQYVRLEVICDNLQTPIPQSCSGIVTWPPLTSTSISYLTNWITQLMSQGLTPILVLTSSTFGGTQDDWQAGLVTDPLAPASPTGAPPPFKNSWVDWAARVANFVAATFPLVTRFEIWNEPHYSTPPDPAALDPAHFASLLNYCAQYMKYDTYPGDPCPLSGISSSLLICSGGILMLDPSPPNPCTDPAYDQGYVASLYGDQTTLYWKSFYGRPPWDRLGIHPYVTANQDPTQPCSGQFVAKVQQLLDQLEGLEETNPLWATEFGTPRLGCSYPTDTTVCEGNTEGGCVLATYYDEAISQASILGDLFNALFAAGQGQALVPTTIELACWFSHTWAPNKGQNFGLTNFCYLPGGSNLNILTIAGDGSQQHWVAWSAFQGLLCGGPSTTFQIAAPTQTFQFALQATAGQQYTIYWGDSEASPYTASGNLDTPSHSYAAAGIYNLVLVGDATQIVALEFFGSDYGVGGLTGTLPDLTGWTSLATLQLGGVLPGSLTVTTLGTPPALASLSLVSINGDAFPDLSGCEALAEIVVTSVTFAGSMNLIGYPALAALVLTTVAATSLTVSGCPALTAVTLTTVNVTGDIAVSDNGALQDLTATTPTVSGDIALSDNGALQTLTVTTPTVSGTMSVSTCPTLPTLTLTGGSVAGGLTLTGCAALATVEMTGTTVSGGALPSVNDPNGQLFYSLLDNGFTSYTTGDLATVTFNGSPSETGNTFSFQGQAFSADAVDAILTDLVTSGTTYGVVDVSGGTSSPPGPSGVTAIAALTANGWQVTTN